MMSKTPNTMLVWKLLVVAIANPMANGQLQDFNQDSSESEKTTTVVRLASDIQWRKLNPARGDASPQAGTIWGDQTKDNESGFLVKFVDGFSSPPHIHNITYRGIVIAGGLHNDDPKAEPMWMKAGSFWTQPAGEVHITSSRGAGIGYVEIQSGPYLVKPPVEAFDNGERPVNMDKSNIVWLDASDTTWIEVDPKKNASTSPQLTFLWGSPKGDETHGTMLRLPAGFSGELKSESSTFKVIVIEGETHFHTGDDVIEITAGGYIGSNGKVAYQLRCDEACVVYIRTKGKYSVVSE
ncbi:MAG: DUF4437 domain-containing protein [Planctomycetota bacterium]